MIRLLVMVLISLPLLAGSAAANNLSKVYINEILYDPAGPDSSNQKMELINYGTSTVVLTNWSICIQFNYKRFPSGASIPPGGIYVIHLNKIGTNTTHEWYTGGYVNLDKASDGVSLFHTYSGFGTPANMEDFVQWGAGGQPRENVAASAGLWTAGAFIPGGPEGQSIAYNNRTATPPNVLPHLVGDYCYEPSTFGMMNSCAIVDQIVLNEVVADPAGPNAGATLVEIYNGHAFSANLTGWQWSTGGANGAFELNQTVPAGGYLLVHLNAAGVNDNAHLYAGEGTPDLDPAAGSFSLYKNSVDFSNPENLVDFVQWGAPGQPGEAGAVLASEWTAGDFISQLPEGHSHGYTGSGSTSTSWCDQDPATLLAATVCETSGVPDGGGPGAAVLRQNYPNPMSRRTTIAFGLERAEERVTVTIFNIAGSPVRKLLDGPVTAGPLALEWDGRDDSGRLLPNGVYVYAVRSGDRITTRKLTIHR